MNWQENSNQFPEKSRTKYGYFAERTNKRRRNLILVSIGIILYSQLGLSIAEDAKLFGILKLDPAIPRNYLLAGLSVLLAYSFLAWMILALSDRIHFDWSSYDADYGDAIRSLSSYSNMARELENRLEKNPSLPLSEILSLEDSRLKDMAMNASREFSNFFSRARFSWSLQKIFLRISVWIEVTIPIGLMIVAAFLIAGGFCGQR